MKKYIALCTAIAIVLSILQSCTATDSNASAQTKNENYTISVIQKEYDEFSNYFVPYICYMNNDVLQHKINQSIQGIYTQEFLDTLYTFEVPRNEKNAQYGWRDAVPSFTLHTDRYLSVNNSYTWIDNGRPSTSHLFFDFYYTIDMSTGEVVYLSDLVNVNDDFIDFIKNSGKIYDSSLYYTQAMNEEGVEKSLAITNGVLNGLSVDYVKELLAQCDLDIGSVLEEYNKKCSFYLIPGYLAIYGIYKREWDETIYINLNDIEEFLKVDKW